MAGGNVRKNEHEIAEMRRRIVELRDEGKEFREIAEIVGRNVKTVWTHYQNAMRQIPAAAIEEHERKRAARLDAQLQRIDMEREVIESVLLERHVQVSNGRVVREMTGRDKDGKPVYGDAIEDTAPLLQAAAALDRLEDREAKLLDLYPKQKISVERAPSELDKRVVQMIERAQERAEERRRLAIEAAEDSAT